MDAHAAPRGVSEVETAANSSALLPGVITLAATPIGNTADASARLCAGLADADLIAAEDTRRLLNLATRLHIQITGHVIAFHEHNERERVHELIQAAQAGKKILVVTDAGMPAISDPGYRLVEAAASAGVQVTVAPGPSAVLSALALSGLATDRFCFEGFLPRKTGEQQRRLAQLASEVRTMVFFESPRRVHATLSALAAAFGGQRAAAMCRELTKTHEEVRRATLEELCQATVEPVRGEVVLVVAGGAPASGDINLAARAALARMQHGERLKTAAAAVAKENGLRPNEVYRVALSLRTDAEAQANSKM